MQRARRRRDARRPVPLTYVYDPSSTSVNTKIQLLDDDRGRGQPEGDRQRRRHHARRGVDPAERYRFIEFFVPGIIAMAIMTSSPVERAQHERRAAPEGHPAQARDDADHARRLARLEHRVPAHPVGHLDGRDPAGQLRRVRRPAAHRHLAAAHRRGRGHRLRRHRHAAHPVREGGRKRVGGRPMPSCFR